MTPISILLVIAIYFVVLIAIAHFTGRKASSQDFFIGSKQSPWYLVAFGMIGASLSGVTFISIPGVIGNLESVNQQFSYMQMVLGYLLGYLIIATVLMPLYYRLQLTSIYQYLEQRFGPSSYKTGASFFLLSRVIGASFRLFLVAMVLQEFVLNSMGVPFPVTVLVTLLLIWTYTFKGGIKTIVYTDTLQTLSMLVAVGLALYFVADGLNLSIGGLASTIADSQYGQFFFWDAKADTYFFKQFFAGAAIALVMTGLDQDMMQKNNSCKNIQDAQLNMFSFSIILVLVNFLFVGLGAGLYLYAQAKGIAIPEKTDQLFPMLALNHFGTAAGLTFIVGLIAAAYSSADSALTSLTTSFCVDILGHENKAQSEAEAKRTRLMVHVGFTAVLFAVILVFRYVLESDVISSLFRVAGYTYGPLLGLYAFGLFTKRPIHDVLAPVVCVLAPVLAYILQAKIGMLIEGYTIGFEILIYNGLLTFLGLWAISEPVSHAD